MPPKEAPLVNGSIAQVNRPTQPNTFFSFDGVSADFELWWERARIYLKKNYPSQAQCAMVETQEDLEKIDDHETHNAELYDFLVMFLDKTSARLAMQEARGNGWKAVKVVKHHHMGSVEDNGMLALMNLVSISKESEETLTEYQIRLKTLVQTVEASDFDLKKLGTVVGLNGLPEEYALFKGMVKRGRCPDFEDFTRMLREEDSELYKKRGAESVVMKVKYTPPQKPSVNKGKSSSCYKCGEKGHGIWKCKNTPKTKWCDNCRLKNHNTDECRKGRRQPRRRRKMKILIQQGQ